MFDLGEGTVRRIDWKELAPVVMLLRVLNLAKRCSVLGLALAGTFLSFGLNAQPLTTLKIHDVPRQLFHSFSVFSTSFSAAPCSTCWGKNILLVVLWLILGTIICRIIAVHITKNERERTSNLYLFFQQRFLSVINAFFLLLAAAALCLIPVKIFAWFSTISGLDYVAAILLPIPLFFALLAVLLLAGLLFGWMLIIAAVCVDGSDGFDAISRAFSYLFQRPLHFVFYWLFSNVIGFIGYCLVWLFTTGVLYLTFSYCRYAMSDIACFWVGLAELVPLAYLAAWFWTSSVVIYILLRKSVDAAPYSEVFSVKEQKIHKLRKIGGAEKDVPIN